MNALNELKAKVLQDKKITGEEVAIIRSQIAANGSLDIEDVKLLVELLSEAREVSPEFDELFFPALKSAILADGQITMDEQFYLLKMLYSDGHVRECEKQFLRDLCREAKEITPEFQSLCDEALSAPAKNWYVGGTPSCQKQK
jgi:hypothetical protein